MTLNRVSFYRFSVYPEIPKGLIQKKIRSHLEALWFYFAKLLSALFYECFVKTMKFWIHEKWDKTPSGNKPFIAVYAIADMGG